MTGEDPFTANRSLLFAVAYEMLGSAAGAGDVLQESWLRWAGADRPQVRDPRAYLIRVVTRQALNRLPALARSREDHVGEWLPEPLLTSPDVAADAEKLQVIAFQAGVREDDAGLRMTGFERLSRKSAWIWPHAGVSLARRASGTPAARCTVSEVRTHWYLRSRGLGAWGGQHAGGVRSRVVR
jgi:hypothetical protein